MDIERAVRDIRHAGLDKQADCVVAHISRALQRGVEVQAAYAELEAMIVDLTKALSERLLEMAKVLEREG